MKNQRETYENSLVNCNHGSVIVRPMPFARVGNDGLAKLAILYAVTQAKDNAVVGDAAHLQGSVI